MTGWWAGEQGDASPRDVPLASVRTSTPVALRFEAGQGATEIIGWVYDKDSPAPGGGPTEQFTLPGRAGAYALRMVGVGHTYEVLVNVKWSGLLVRDEVTHAFRLKVE